MKPEDKIKAALYILQSEAHDTAKKKGWWDKPREDGTIIAKCHEELSEVLQALSRPEGLIRDKHCPDFLEVEIELADLLIRVMDFCEKRGWALPSALLAKMEYNKTRPYRHGGKKL